MPIDKKEGPGTSAGRPGDNPAQKRPHATLDLKATEVVPPAASAGDAAGQTSDAKTADTKAPDAKSSAVSGATTAPGNAGEKAKASEGSPGSGKPAAATTAAAPVREATIVRRGGSMLSHVLAGVAGGVLSLAIIEWAAPSLGINTPTQEVQRQTTALQTRIASLEKAASGSDVGTKLTAAEDRLAKLEDQASALGGAQTKLGEDQRSLSEKVAANPIAQETEKRLTAVDERLATIAAAAEGEGGKGVAQVTALTGKVKDLQASVGRDIEALRKAVPQDIADRVAALGQTSQAAQEGITRLERDLADARLETTRHTQRLEAFKADIDRSAAATRVVQEETGKLVSGFEDLKATVASQVKGGVGAAVSPVLSKITSLEANLDDLSKAEGTRRENAERIVLSLELANLKRAIDSGRGYAAGLADVRGAAGSKLNLAALERFKDSGVPTVADLQRDFRPVANAVIDASVTPAEGSVMDKLVAGAKSVVRVRNLNPAADDKSAEAIVARMQEALSLGQLGDVLALSKDLPPAAAGPAQDWLAKTEARYSVDRAIGDIEGQLKKSLTSAEPPAAIPVAPGQGAPPGGITPPAPPAAKAQP